MLSLFWKKKPQNQFAMFLFYYLTGEGANRFAASHGITQVPPDSLVTPHAKEELEIMKKYSKSVDTLFNVSL